MSAFRTLSIKRKLVSIILLVSSSVLIMACAAFVAYDQITFRRTIRDDLNSLAKVVATSSRGALSYDDQRLALQYLSSLKAKKHVVGGCFYKDSAIFAHFHRAGAPASQFPPAPKSDGLRLENGHFEVFEPVLDRDGIRVGTLFIQYDLDEMSSRLKRFSGMVGIVLLAAVLAMIQLSSRLQKIISTPILSLANTARIVSEQKDYGIRAEKQSEDEIGFLIDRFNEMLVQIEIRDRAVKEANAQLLQSEQKALAGTQAKSSFLANMSHELRTPMNSIIGFSEVLLDPKLPVDDATRKQFLENILGSGRHLLNLINDILDLSKVEAGKVELRPEDFHLAETLQGVMAVVHPLAMKKQQELTLRVDESLGLVYHDTARFKQIFYNLLSNAIKFTPDGGKVIATALPSLDGCFEVSVTDTGIGIKPEDHASVFEEFKQIDTGYARKQQGTGLGLALVRQFVRLMGGDISVKSQIGEGATFTVRLPLRQGAASSESAEGIEASGHEPLVLVIEDDPNSASLLSFYLTHGGYQVRQAAGGEEIQDLVKELKPVAITLDILLPRVDGWQVLRKLKADPETREIPVIVISVIDDKKTAQESGAAARLVKPVSSDTLLGTLKSVIKPK